jgi:L-malate glycosyltransferase
LLTGDASRPGGFDLPFAESIQLTQPRGLKKIPRVVPALRPMRVCFMIDELDIAGTESQLLALIRHLNRSRVLPFLCLLKGERASSRALEPRTCLVSRLGVRSLHHPSTFLKTLQLVRWLRQWRIDVMQVYFPDSTYVGVPAARLAGVPLIVRVRNNLNHDMTPVHRVLSCFCNRIVTHTAANCDSCRAAVVAGEHVPPASVHVLENGVDLDRFLGVPVYLGPNAGATRRVGVVANLRPVKGLEVFIRAAALVAKSYPDLRFEIAGQGELRWALQEKARAGGLGGRFLLRGALDDIPAFLAGLDLAVLPSLSEGMSNAVLEYMAAGRPIVATAVGATPRLLQDGVHGLVVPPNDPRALAAALDRLLRDPALACRLAAAARRRAHEEFSREAMVRRFEAFYLRLCQEPAPRRSGEVRN